MVLIEKRQLKLQNVEVHTRDSRGTQDEAETAGLTVVVNAARRT
jgi:hypothetical protein